MIYHSKQTDKRKAIQQGTTLYLRSLRQGLTQHPGTRKAVLVREGPLWLGRDLWLSKADELRAGRAPPLCGTPCAADAQSAASVVQTTL